MSTSTEFQAGIMIRMDNVSVTYPGGITALHSLSTTFREGEFSVLLGRSGAGKSTLLRCINLLGRPSTGCIIAKDIGNLDDRAKVRAHRCRTAMIFQQHQLVGRQTALQNVLVARLGYHSALRTLLPLSRGEQLIAVESLDRVGLLHKAMERVDRLSGGEQQRVGIARALAQRPRLILADEPVASLDPVTADRVMSLLHGICNEMQITAVVSLHQVDIAKRYADRVLGLEGGKVVFDGPPAGLSERVLSLVYRSSQSRETVGTAPPDQSAKARSREPGSCEPLVRIK
jgi:phosphonate transport system ATP-binding protein